MPKQKQERDGKRLVKDGVLWSGIARLGKSTSSLKPNSVPLVKVELYVVPLLYLCFFNKSTAEKCKVVTLISGTKAVRAAV